MKIVADENIPFVADYFCSIGDVEVVPGREIGPSVLAGAEVLLVRSVTKVDSDLLAGSSVRFVGTVTIGAEHIEQEYLESKSIGFASGAGSNANSVAEYVVAALLSIGRKHKIKLDGKTIGIIGVGNIGSRVEKKVTALGMKVVLNDPPLRRESGDEKYRPIEELFDCDFITLHTPLTFEGVDKTFHLVDEGFFKLLKRGCVFLNTARGGVVDTSALKGAKKAGRLKAAVLDVWENEPNIDNELLRMVDLGTPHIAGYSLDGKVNGMMMIYEAVCEYFGLEVKKRIEDFLPEPEKPQVAVKCEGRDEQEILHETVQEIYPINRDDFNTREILMVPEAERDSFFDDLRKDYPVRREFQNTKVLLKSSKETVAKKLAGIGFKVSNV